MALPKGIPIKKVKEKSPSNRLRAVIYLYWEQLGCQGDSEAFYEKHVNAIIEQYKSKLKPRV